MARINKIEFINRTLSESERKETFEKGTIVSHKMELTEQLEKIIELAKKEFGEEVREHIGYCIGFNSLSIEDWELISKEEMQTLLNDEERLQSLDLTRDNVIYVLENDLVHYYFGEVEIIKAILVKNEGWKRELFKIINNL